MILFSYCPLSVEGGGGPEQKNANVKYLQSTFPGFTFPGLGFTKMRRIYTQIQRLVNITVVAVYIQFYYFL